MVRLFDGCIYNVDNQTIKQFCYAIYLQVFFFWTNTKKMISKNLWNNNTIVKQYLNLKDLQKPEQYLLNQIRKKSYKTMLDIGVGGGRTTKYFARFVQEYIGIDIADNMVLACNNRFSNLTNVSFKVASATNLSEFKDDYFDFVLFSFNGLDCLNIPTERNSSLLEMKRVLAPEGICVFSSHNINSIEKLYKIRPSKNILKTIKRSLVAILILLFNGPKASLKQKDLARIRDGVHLFRLQLTYIKPSIQIQQLTALGFKNIKAYSLIDGHTLSNEEIKSVTDDWIYYSCQK